MESLKFKIGDRPWYKGRTQVELHGVGYNAGKVIWYCRALGGVSFRSVEQSDLTEKAHPDAEQPAY